MRRIVEYFKSNLWALPTLIVLISIGAAYSSLLIDRDLSPGSLIENWPWIFATGADGAREMLSTVASSVVTVAGVAFSITIVVLSMASNQYSPRVLRTFMGDWKSQFVLGGLLGIFAFCLLVLRTVRSEGDHEFVPSFSVFLSVFLGFIGIGLIIYFIHHVANSIRASNIIHSVFVDTSTAISSLLGSKEKAGPELAIASHLSMHPVLSHRTGYIQRIEIEKLREAAAPENCTVQMHRTVGDFIIEGHPLMSISVPADPRMASLLLNGITIGSVRTLEQDIAFGLSQLVDIALKGLSPGINDTTTALICIDYIGALLCKLSTKNLNIEKKPLTTSDRNIFFKEIQFLDYLNLSFDQIRQNGAKNPTVIKRILEAFNSILQKPLLPERKCDVSRHLEKIVFVIETGEPWQDYRQLQAFARHLRMKCDSAHQTFEKGQTDVLNH